LWSEILLACSILLLEKYQIKVGALALFEFTAAMNGGVMFLYGLALAVINSRRLPAAIRIPGWRLALLVATVGFFGFFSVWAAYSAVLKIFAA
jgi:hypothetical protein